MIEVLVVLAPIALIDSISPIRFGQVVTLLGSDRPLVTASTFILGLFSGYFVLGLLISLGLDRAIDWLFPKNPEPVDYVLSAIIGLVLVILGLRNLTSPKLEKPVEEPAAESLGGIFAFSWLVTFATAPAAVPYLAGIDQILKADITDLQQVLALAFYCAVYVSPLVALLLLRLLMGEAGIAVLRKINVFVERFMPPAMSVLFALLGILLLIDAAGFFLFDRPLW